MAKAYLSDNEDEALKSLDGRPIGPGSALRYVRLAYPDATEDERKSLLWDELRQGRIGFFISRNAISYVGPPRSCDGEAFLGLDEDIFWREALFSEADVAKAFPLPQLRTKTKTTIPVAEMLAEMRRRAAAGELAPKWAREAAALARWAEAALPPGTPCSKSGIRGIPALQAEYDKLSGLK